MGWHGGASQKEFGFVEEVVYFGRREGYSYWKHFFEFAYLFPCTFYDPRDCPRA